MNQTQEQSELSVEISDEEADVPSPKRPREDKKYSGAHTYKSKFQVAWQKKWPCIVAVKDNPHMFHCTVCFKAVSCAHQGERDVTRHIDSAQHKKNCRAVQHVSPLSFHLLPLKRFVCCSNTCIYMYVPSFA